MKTILKKVLSVVLAMALCAALLPAVGAKKTQAATDVVSRVYIKTTEPLEKLYAHEYPLFPEFEFESVQSSGSIVTLDDLRFDMQLTGYSYPYEYDGDTEWVKYQEDDLVSEKDNRLIVAIYLVDGINAVFANDVEVYLNGELMSLQYMYPGKQDADFYLDVLTYVKVPDIELTASPALTAPNFGDTIVNPTITIGFPNNVIFEVDEEYTRWEDEYGYSLPGVFNKKNVQYSVWLNVTDSDYWGVLDYTDTKAYINGEEFDIVYNDSSTVHIETPVYDTGGVYVEVFSYLTSSGNYDNYVSLNGSHWDTAAEGDYANGGTVTLYAQADEGCNFVGWRKGDASSGPWLGTDPVMTVTVTEDTQFWAIFDKDVPATGHLTDTVDYTFDEATGTVTLIPTGADGTGSARLNYYDDNPLYGNMQIKHVVIQEGITEIEYTFRNNDNIETVYIPASLTDIFNQAFDRSRICGAGFTVHPDNPYYASNGDGNLYDKSFTTMYRYAQGTGVTEYEIPDGVKYLARYCFTEIDLDRLILKNEGLQLFDYGIYGGYIDHLIIEEGVEDLGDFSNFICQDTVRNLPSTVVDVGTQNDIIDADNLESIKVADGGSYYTSINGILYEYYDSELKTELTLWKYPQAKSGDSYTTPAGVTRVEWIALNFVSELKNIVFSEEVKRVADSSIRYMDDITVTFENPECEINNSAIIWCKNVTIKGMAGSTAESFAANNSFAFISIGDSLGKMDAPTNLRWDGETARWDPVDGATRYELRFYYEKDDGTVYSDGTYMITDDLDAPSYGYPSGLWYSDYSYYFTVSAQRTLYEPSDPATSPVAHGRFTRNNPEFSIDGSIMTITPYIDDEGNEADNYYVWFVNDGTGIIPSVLSGFRLYGEHTVDLQKMFDEKNVGGAIPYGNYRISIMAHKVIYGWEVSISKTSDEIIWNYGKDISKCEITLEQSSYMYDGSLKEPGVVVKDGGTTLTEGTDYELSYKNNTGPGMGTVTIYGIGNYSSAVEKSFIICFTDVPMTHSYRKAVYWAVEEGIAAGYTGKKLGLFGVGDDITRGQVVMFLWRAAGKPEPEKHTQTFSDVPTTSNFYKAIQWAVETGITGGYTGDRAGQFGPSDNCTRGQIAMFLWRFADKPAPAGNTQTFSDVPTKHNFYKAIQWAAENGITAGYSDGTFGVNKTCTRGHCVTFLYRMDQYGFLK